MIFASWLRNAFRLMHIRAYCLWTSEWCSVECAFIHFIYYCYSPWTTCARMRLAFTTLALTLLIAKVHNEQTNAKQIGGRIKKKQLQLKVHFEYAEMTVDTLATLFGCIKSFVFFFLFISSFLAHPKRHSAHIKHEGNEKKIQMRKRSGKCGYRSLYVNNIHWI